jgi:hypothetical protein
MISNSCVDAKLQGNVIIGEGGHAGRRGGVVRFLVFCLAERQMPSQVRVLPGPWTSVGVRRSKNSAEKSAETVHQTPSWAVGIRATDAMNAIVGWFESHLKK